MYMKDMVKSISDICRMAGAAILEVYDRNDLGVETKTDNSPLTAADTAANTVIVKELATRFPDIPILTEEAIDIAYAERKSWRRYFLVDPLDGTKEFISRNGEFTVNIALIEDGKPVLGVVYVPVKQTLYAGLNGDEKVAWVETVDGPKASASVRALQPRLDEGLPLTVVASRRHGGEMMEKCMKVLDAHFDQIELTNMGSSLKLCLIAQGKADLYPRLAPTSEWDTAAAQAIVEAAGGVVVDFKLKPLRYNTKADILNPWFYVIGDPGYPWDQLLGQVERD